MKIGNLLRHPRWETFLFRSLMFLKNLFGKKFDLPACAIKAYDSNKKQLNLIPDDQFFNGLFRLWFVVVPWDLYSRFLLFHLEAHVKPENLFILLSFSFFSTFCLFFSSRLWDFKQFHSSISDVEAKGAERDANKTTRCCCCCFVD